MKVAGVLLGCFGLAGCMTVDPDHRVAGQYFGYVCVLGPAIPRRGVQIENVTALGGWIESEPASRGLSGAGIGYRQLERATTAADSCSLTILVTNETQLRSVEALVRSYSEGQACVIKRNDKE